MGRFREKNQQYTKMKKQEFLEDLEEYLVGIPKNEKEEILQDYKEHFKIGKKNKRGEGEIIKSLGEPKEIAREMRMAFSSSKKSELKLEAIETWVAMKKFTKQLFYDTEEKISNVIQKDEKKTLAPKIILGALIILAAVLIINSWFFRILALVVIGYLVYNYYKNDNNKIRKTKKVRSKTTSKKENRGVSTIKIILSLAFNLLFFIWFWIGLFLGIIGLFIGGLSIIISGAAIIGLGIFALITHSDPLTKNILFSGLFSGIGLLILGSLLTSLFVWFIKLYLKVTQAYIQLNSRFIRK